MIRICRPAVISEVTGNARCRKTGVDIVLVTSGALHIRMGAGQRELCRAVIERRSRPGSRIVAGRTLLRESRLDMIRIRCPAVIGEVA
jgi:hypothetical protein